MKKALLYCRVSTKEQKDSGLGLDVQEEACIRKAQEMGCEIVTVIKEDVSGTTPFFERPNGQYIIKLINARRIDGIIVQRSDRFTRDTVNGLMDARMILKSNVELYIGDIGPIPSEDDIIVLIKFFGGSDERKKINQRLADGRRKKAMEGTRENRGNRWVGSGTIPYGYRKIGVMRTTQLEVDQDEAEIVRWIFETYTGLHGGRMNLQEIADHLNNKGIPSPGTRRKGNTLGWWKPTLRNILKYTGYVGVFNYAGIEIANPGLAFVDPALFEAAKVQFRTNFENAKRNHKYSYLLSGRLVCTCGRKMSGISIQYKDTEKLYQWYRCTRVAQLQFNTCHMPMLKMQVLDDEVWKWVETHILDEDALFSGLDLMDERLESENRYKQERLDAITNTLDKIGAKINKLLNAFGDSTDPVISESIENQVKQLSLQRQGYEDTKKELESALNQNTLTPEVRQEIITLAKEVRERFGDATPENKRYLIEALGVKAMVTGDGKQHGLDITCHLTGVNIHSVQLLL